MKKILCFLCLVSCLHADISWHISHIDHAALSDKIPVTLTVNYPKGYQVGAPDVNRLLGSHIAHLSPAFTLISKEEGEAEDLSNGMVERSFHYVLEPWEAGTHYLSFGALTFVGGQREEKRLTEPFAVDITAPDQIVLQPAKVLLLTQVPQLELDATNQQRLAAENLEQPARNRQIAEARTFPWHILVGYIALITVGFAGGLIYWQYRKGLRPPVVEPPKPQEVAISRLKKLEKQIPKTPEESEAFFVDLSAAVREYLEHVTGVAAPEKTTPEFLAEAAQKLKEQDRQLVEELLTQADLIKFARQETTADRCREALKIARQIVGRS